MDGDLLTGALRETLDVFDTVGPGTPLTTSEVQDQLDVGRRSTYERLDRLAAAGYVETKAVGSKGRVWWVPVTERHEDDSSSGDSAKQVETSDLGRPEVVSCLIELHGSHQSEVEPYQRILETIEDGVYVVDSSGRISLVNDAFCEMLGYSRAELVGMDARTLVDQETVEHARQYWEQLYDGPREFVRFEADVNPADGSTFRAEGVFSLLERQDGSLERVGVVRDVTERQRRERALEQSRERLAALNDLNLAIRDITHAVLEQSTRTEIEHVVCEALVDSDSYGFAWTGDLDGETEMLRVRANAGGDGDLDGLQLSVDPEDPEHCASAARAIVDDEIQITEWTPPDVDRLPWADVVRDIDLRTSADIPIGHESVVYGVLSVYTDREGGFRDEEAALFGFLGEVMGHAIASIERKRALMNDELLELEFRIDDVLETLGAEDAPGDVVLETTIPVGDGTYITYGTTSTELLDPLYQVIDAVPYLDSLTVLDDRGSEVRFEARMIDPPVVSAVSNFGGYIDVARIADGDFYLRIHLAAGTDSRQIVGIVRETYPTAQLVSQRQIARGRDSPARLSRVLSRELTDRQRIVLETAYAAGYFDSPRLNSGSEIAKTLGISGPTFHEHLRKALHTFLGRALLDRTEVDGDHANREAHSGEQSR